jgi:hypothetical protein
MRAVIELSREIIDEFKERQKTRLQRTVVGGTDAACAKVKGKCNCLKSLSFFPE